MINDEQDLSNLISFDVSEEKEKIANTIRPTIEQLFNEKMPLRVMAKSSGKYDIILEEIPRILAVLLYDEYGIGILKRMDLYGQITEYLTSHSK